MVGYILKYEYKIDLIKLQDGERIIQRHSISHEDVQVLVGGTKSLCKIANRVKGAGIHLQNLEI